MYIFVVKILTYSYTIFKNGLSWVQSVLSISPLCPTPPHRKEGCCLLVKLDPIA